MRKCPVCSYKNRLSVDKQILTGISLAQISRETGLKEQSLLRHKSHINRQLLTVMNGKNLVASEYLFQEVQMLLDKTKSLLIQAENENNIPAALMGCREFRSTLMFITGLGIKLKELEIAANPKLAKDIPDGIDIRLIDDDGDEMLPSQTNSKLTGREAVEKDLEHLQMRLKEKREEMQEFDDDEKVPASETILDVNTSIPMPVTADKKASTGAVATNSARPILTPSPKFKRKSIKKVKPVKLKDKLGPDNNSIKCPVKKKPVKKKQAGAWVAPHLDGEKIDMSELKNNPEEDKWAALREKYCPGPKPKKDPLAGYSEEELDKIDMEGRTLRENLEVRPRHEIWR